MKLIYKLLLSKSRKQLTIILIIALLTLTIVFTSLISVTSMITSMENKIISLENGHIEVKFSTRDIKEANLKHLKSIDTITNYSAIVYSKTNNSEMNLKSVDYSYFTDKRKKDLSIKNLVISDKPSILISRTTAEKLELDYEKKVVALVVSNGKAKMQMFDVIGIYDTSYSYIDDKMAYIVNAQPLDILNVKSSQYLLLDSKDNIDSTMFSLYEYDHYIFAQTYYEIHPEIYNNFTNSRNSLNLVFALLLIFCASYIALSAFNIAHDNSREMVLLTINGQDEYKTACLYSLIVSFMIFIVEIPAFILSIRLVKIIPYITKSSSLFNYYIKDFVLVIPIYTILFITVSFVILVFIIFIIVIKRNIKKSVNSFILGV